MKSLRWILTFVIAFSLSYGLFSLYSWDIITDNWSREAKGWSLFFGLFLGSVCIVYDEGRLENDL